MKESPQKRRPRNKWAKVRPQTCSICRQTTHENDRDFDHWVWLEWTQRHFTKDGAEHPTGNECYRCFHTRRRHFKTWELGQIVDKMEEDPSLRDKFEEARRDDIQQIGEWSGVQITPASWSDLVHKSIEETFVEGLFVPMFKVAAQRRLQYTAGDEADCKRACEAAGLRVVRDDRGVLGVEFADHDQGSYRFKRGLGKYNERGARSSHDNSGDAERQWEWNELKRESDAAATGRFLKPEPHTEPLIITVNAIPDDKSHVGSFETRASSPQPVSRAMQPFGGSPSAVVTRRRLSGKGGSRAASSAAASDKHEHDGEDSVDIATLVATGAKPPGAVPVEKKGKRTQAEVHSEKLQEISQTCAWPALWKDATKRKVEGCLQRLQTAGIKTGAKVSDPILVDLSQKILAQHEEIQRRWDVVQKFKRAPEELLVVLGDQELRDWATADVVTSVAMILFAGVALVNDVDCAKLEVLCSIMSVASPENLLSMRQPFLNVTSEDELAQIVAAQKNTINALVDKTFAKMSLDESTKICLHLDEVLPQPGLRYFHELDPANESFRGFVHGFCSAAWIDLSFLRLVGSVLQAEGSDMLPRNLSLQMWEIYQNQEKLGQRVRAHVRHRGSHVAEKIATRVWAAFRRQHECCRHAEAISQDLDKYSNVVSSLQQAIEWDSDVDVYNTVVDIIGEDQARERIKALFSAHACSLEAGEDEGVAEPLAREFQVAWLSAAHRVSAAIGHGKPLIECVIAGGDLNKLPSLQNTGQDTQVAPDEVLELEAVEVFGSMLGCLNIEGMLAAEGELVKNAIEGIQRVAKTYRLLLAGSAERELVVSLGSWSELWRRAAAKGPLEPDWDKHIQNKEGIALFIQNCATLDVREVLVSHIIRYASEPDMSAYRSSLRGCSTHLPQPETTQILDAAAIGIQVASVLPAARDGRLTQGMLELCMLIDLARKRKAEQPLVFKRMGVDNDEPIAQIVDEQLTTHLLKLQLARSNSDDFIDKYSGITKAVETWSFDGLDWAKSPTASDPLAERIASLAQTHPSQVAMHRQLMKVISWMHPSRRADLEAAAAALEEDQKRLKHASILMAQVILCSLLMLKEDERAHNWNEAVAASRDFAKSKLKLTDQELGEKLIGKMRLLAPTKAPANKKKTVDAAATVEVAQALPPVKERPRKAFRKLP